MRLLGFCFFGLLFFLLLKEVSSNHRDNEYRPTYNTTSPSKNYSELIDSTYQESPALTNTAFIDTSKIDSTLFIPDDPSDEVDEEISLEYSSSPDFDELQKELDRLKTLYSKQTSPSTYSRDWELERLRDKINRLSQNDFNSYTAPTYTLPSSYNLVNIDAEIQRLQREYSLNSYSSPIISLPSIDVNSFNAYSIPTSTASSSSYYSTSTNSNHVHVKGYYRSNGTYVESHYRTAPNSTTSDNFSSYPNLNPYTGKVGTKRN